MKETSPMLSWSHVTQVCHSRDTCDDNSITVPVDHKSWREAGSVSVRVASSLLRCRRHTPDSNLAGSQHHNQDNLHAGA